MPTILVTRPPDNNSLAVRAVGRQPAYLPVLCLSERRERQQDCNVRVDWIRIEGAGVSTQGSALAVSQGWVASKLLPIECLPASRSLASHRACVWCLWAGLVDHPGFAVCRTQLGGCFVVSMIFYVCVRVVRGVCESACCNRLPWHTTACAGVGIESRMTEGVGEWPNTACTFSCLSTQVPIQVGSSRAWGATV